MANGPRIDDEIRRLCRALVEVDDLKDLIVARISTALRQPGLTAQEISYLRGLSYRLQKRPRSGRLSEEWR